MKVKQNILLIMTDQHRLSAVGCYGSTPCLTPNLDRMAAEGVRFETAYTSCPVCSPARASVMTGLYPHQHGICCNVHDLGSSIHELRDSGSLLSRRVREKGYGCGYTGKWHLGTDLQQCFMASNKPSLPQNVGFIGQNFPGHGGGGFNFPEYKEFLQSNGFVNEVRRSSATRRSAACFGIDYGILSGPTESTVPAFLTDHTIDLIERFKTADEPFFIWHNFWGPHSPFYVPYRYYEMYRNVEIPRWANYVWDKAESNAPHQVKLHPDRKELSWEDWAEAVRHYYAFTTLIDEQIGRMIDHLRNTGLLENTWIIFVSDHGETLGSHGGLTDKGWHHFEEIQRIPFIVHPPESREGYKRGTVRDEWISLLDLYPTVLDIAGASDDNTMGCSILPILKDQKVPWRDSVVVEFSGVNSLATSMITIRAGDFKYGWNCSSWDELYNLGNDPWEMENIAQRPEYAGKLKEMRLLLDAWMQETDYRGRRMYAQSRLA